MSESAWMDFTGGAIIGLIVVTITWGALWFAKQKGASPSCAREKDHDEIEPRRRK
jgi:hypothetical protein